MPDLHLAARRAALKYDVDPNIFLRMIGQESGFNPHARSPAGAQGIAQFIPSTARAYGVNLNDNRVTDDLEGAAKYLRANLDRTGGSYTRALSIYNSGSPTGYQHIAETKNYVRSILGGRTPTSPSSGGSQGGGDSSGLAGRLSGSVTPGQVTGGGFDPGTPDVSSLADLLGSSRPQPVAPQLPAAPFSSSKYLHMGQSPVVAQSQPEASGGGIDSLLAAMQGSGQEIPETSVSAAQTSVSGSAPTAHASSAGSVSGHRSPLLELFYNGPGGINAKNGQREPRGFVSGHTDHVHVAAGPKTVVKLGQLAQDMGLHVGENPHYGGVHPVHVKGSYHYKGEAIDVSGTPQQMERFNRKVASLYGLAGR